MSQFLYSLADSVLAFSLVASLSVFFGSLFIVAGIITSRRERSNITVEVKYSQSLGNFILVSMSSLLTATITLVAMYLL